MPKDDRYAHLGGDDNEESEEEPEAQVTESSADGDEEEGLRVTIQQDGEEVDVVVDDESVTVDDLRTAIQQTPNASATEEMDGTAEAVGLHPARPLQQSTINLGLLTAGAVIGGTVMLVRNRYTKK